MHKRIKIGLSLILLAGLIDAPYWYYMLLRFLVMALFLYLAYESHVKEDNNDRWVFFFSALLFQPFFKIYFGSNAHAIWNFIDVFFALALLMNVLVKAREN